MGIRRQNAHIQKFVKEIMKKMMRTALRVAPFLVGIDSRVKAINLWLQEGSAKVGIAAIYGMGGIGKTTIAKTVYNQNFERFDCSSFLANIRESSQLHNSLIRLQRQLILDISKGRREKIRSIDEGISKIKDAVSGKRVLLVLDDVDHLEQLSKIFGLEALGWLYPGSKIIITSRNEKLQMVHESCQRFKVEILNDIESLKLFNWHAFKQGSISECYMEHAKEIVKRCGGIPVALEVLGSSLYGRSVDLWESALRKMEFIIDGQILEVLKLSYDSLQDDHDKNLFLDIAFFFIGKDRDFIVTILDECGFFTIVGIENLVHRGLITITEENKLMMHRLLQDMCREIIRQESLREPGKRSILWHHTNVLEILTQETGTEKIEGLILNLHEAKEDLLIKSTMYAQGSSWIRRNLGFVSLQFKPSALTESFSTSNGVHLETRAFSKMCNIKLLQLNHVSLSGGYEEFPKKLKYLSWRGFHLKSTPSNFCMEKLVALDMRNSSLVQAWKGTKCLESLKILNLSHSRDLSNTPDFSGAPKLERLILKDCINLVEVHESIGMLGRLVLLNLKGCKNLRTLPRSMGQLESLETLILSSCSMLGELPNFKSSLFWSLVSPTTCLKSNCFSLEFLPSSLETLDLMGCHLSDDVMPIDMSGLSSLQHLNLGGNQFSNLLESIKGLAMLKSLILNSCTRLQSLPELPLSIEKLDVKACKSLERMKNVPREPMEFYGCENLVEVPSSFRLEPFVNFNAKMIHNLGFTDFESCGNVEVELINEWTKTAKKCPVQGVYEYGIFSTFFPGAKVPHWFSIRSNRHSGVDVIRFAVPSLANVKLQGFTFCTMPRGNESMLWFSYWNVGNKFEGGDHVQIVFNMLYNVKLEEVGVHLVYDKVDDDEKDIKSNGREITQESAEYKWWVRSVDVTNPSEVIGNCKEYPRAFEHLLFRNGDDHLPWQPTHYLATIETSGLDSFPFGLQSSIWFTDKEQEEEDMVT